MQLADQLAAMMPARDDGLIAGVGLSNVSLEQLRHAVAGTEIVCVQNMFHLADRRGPPSSRSASAVASRSCRSARSAGPGVRTNPVLTSPVVVHTAARLGCTSAECLPQ